ncbi:MAG: ribosome maturation factor RimP [Steroidobacteraceae bacterium]
MGLRALLFLWPLKIAWSDLGRRSRPVGLDAGCVEQTGHGRFGVITTMSATLRERLIALIEPLVGRLGYELVELEQTSGRGSAVVRLFIDGPEGVGLTDCERVSREVSALLDVEDPIPTAYALEISSPGLDRVLRTQAHFARFVGARVLVELAAPREGRRRYTGTLLSADEVGIALEVDGQRVPVSFAEIGKARLTG